MKQETKTCQNCKQNFVIESDDFVFYEKIQVPPPTWCPQCRLQRRLSWRNERTLHKNTCAKCKKSMISVYAPETGLTVYCSPCWWSDSWEGLDYGVDFDSQKPFIQQVRDLLQKVPVMSAFGLYTTLVNSDYTNAVSYLKNCYYITHADTNEDCAYGSMINKSKNCVDNLMINGCEKTYESVNCRKCYETLFSWDCEGCHSISFCRNCIGCSNCFGCVNVRNKSYYIFNEAYSKEEYEKKIKELVPHTVSEIRTMKEQCEKLWNQAPQKFIHERHNVHVTGDYIYNSKNTFDCYDMIDGEDCRFSSFITPGGIKDSYDFSHYGTASELLYETLQSGHQASRIFFSWWAVDNVRNIEYSMFTVGCSNIFGSVGIKKKEYCILNKQYTKNEYEKLREEIIKQMNGSPYKDAQGNVYKYGEFFPTELSPFGYNEADSQTHFAISEAEAKRKGYNWRDLKEKDYKFTKKISDLPDTIQKTDDSITKEIIECEHKGKCNENCATAFRVIPQELAFYKSMNISLPHLCPSCRHHARLKWRNPITLQRRTCMCAGTSDNKNIYQNAVTHPHGNKPCPNSFETTYAPDRPEIVYCEQCYQNEVA